MILLLHTNSELTNIINTYTLLSLIKVAKSDIKLYVGAHVGKLLLYLYSSEVITRLKERVIILHILSAERVK